MSDEIKEILFLLHNDRLTECGKRKLEDYITNLQEENEMLRKNQRFHKKLGDDYIFCLEDDKETYKDMIFYLQDRIDKAIEYINTHYLNANEPNLLNILQRDCDGEQDGEVGCIEMEEDIKVIQNVIYNDQGNKMSYVDVDHEEGEKFINATENLIKGYKEQQEKIVRKENEC